ncbi:hypothetical protein [Kordiimonas sp.]|uniref:hypothetical protein n=1 Tax=Kordiimonas sp. TaxID=1970157 RepID=UPI003A8F9EB6
MKRLLFILVPFMAIAPAQAEQFWAAGIRITGVAVVAQDSNHPDFNNIVWVGLNDTTWLGEGCGQAAAGGLAFSAQNRLLYDLVIRAAEGGWRVTVKAEDTDRIGDLCRLMQVTTYFGD